MRKAGTRARLLVLAVVAIIAAWGLAHAANTPEGPTASPVVKSVASPGATTRAPAAPATGTASVHVTVAIVSKHIDGDTIHVRMPDGTDEKVRFIGVNTPESTIRHEPYGKEASTYTARRLPIGTRVWLETDVGLRDRYGRLLAYVWLAPPGRAGAAEVRASMFNAELLIRGYAQLMTIPPDVKYADAFLPLQAEARDASRGLWGIAP
jgi:micrococcal nuclease